MLTNRAPVKAIDFNALPFRAVTHPTLPSPGKERSTLNADSLPNEGGLGWVLTNLAPAKAIDFNTIPLRVVTHPNLPSLGKECSTLSAGFLSNDGRSEWGTLSRQLQAYSLAPCGRGQNFKLSSAKLRNSGEGSTPAQRRSTC